MNSTNFNVNVNFNIKIKIKSSLSTAGNVWMVSITLS
jgi:hypothetical protein